MIKVIKIGGNIVDNPQKLERFLADFASLEGKKILVHGGGKVATTISKALGIETQMIEGRRVTDHETLKVVTMVYAGWINKSIAGKLQSLGCDAVGLCGVDGRLIESKQREANPVDYGFVGDPQRVNTQLIDQLTAGGHTLVLAPITLDAKTGSPLNTNADTVASTIACAVAQAGEEVELVYCFEKNGVLADVNDDDSVIGIITPGDFAELKVRGAVADGMIPKLENAFKAIERGVSRVVICNAERIAAAGYGGTTLRK